MLKYVQVHFIASLISKSMKTKKNKEGQDWFNLDTFHYKEILLSIKNEYNRGKFSLCMKVLQFQTVPTNQISTQKIHIRNYIN